MTKWGEHRPIWKIRSRYQALYPSLRKDIQVDVAVVGGGITGVTTALHLKEAGLSVALITNSEIGSGTTGSTTGHLTAVQDISFKSLKSKFGERKSQQLVQANMAAINTVEHYINTNHIQCDFTRLDGYKYSEFFEDLESLEEEAAIASELGLRAEMVSDVPLPFPVPGGFRVSNQAQFDAYRYICALAADISGLSEGSSSNQCHVFTNTQVEQIDDGDPCVLTTSTRVGESFHRAKVVASSVVLATHTPLGSHLSLQARIAPYNSYVIAVKLRHSAPNALFWDTSDPYFYTRRLSHTEDDVVLVGGCDHKTGQSNDLSSHFEELEAYVQERFDYEDIQCYWMAELFEPVDGVPYIGRVPFSSNLFTATGFSGVGLTNGTMAARLLSDLVLGRVNPLASVFDPERVNILASISRFASENANVVKKFFLDRISHEDRQTIESIPLGEGGIVEIGGELIAIHRGTDNNVCALSPVCKHMRGIVHWNSVDKTWDCPLHGGRYNAHGECIYGPPTNSLESVIIEPSLHQSEQPAEYREQQISGKRQDKRRGVA